MFNILLLFAALAQDYLKIHSKIFLFIDLEDHTFILSELQFFVNQIDSPQNPWTWYLNLVFKMNKTSFSFH